MPEKQCTKCGQIKDFSLFHLDKKNKDGRRSICKTCRSIISYRIPKKNKMLETNIRRGIVRALKSNKANKTFVFFDFSITQLKLRLESLFNNDMTWDNFGRVWGIDFIIPMKYFKFSKNTMEEIKKCFSLWNIRPLEMNLIRKKQGRLFWEDVQKYALFGILPDGEVRFNDKDFKELTKSLDNNT